MFMPLNMFGINIQLGCLCRWKDLTKQLKDLNVFCFSKLVKKYLLKKQFEAN